MTTRSASAPPRWHLQSEWAPQGRHLPAAKDRPSDAPFLRMDLMKLGFVDTVPDLPGFTDGSDEIGVCGYRPGFVPDFPSRISEFPSRIYWHKSSNRMAASAAPLRRRSSVFSAPITDILHDVIAQPSESGSRFRFLVRLRVSRYRSTHVSARIPCLSPPAEHLSRRRATSRETARPSQRAAGTVPIAV